MDDYLGVRTIGSEGVESTNEYIKLEFEKRKNDLIYSRVSLPISSCLPERQGQQQFIRFRFFDSFFKHFFKTFFPKHSKVFKKD